MFKSDSLRELMQLPRGPGPAFYKQTGPVDKKVLTTNPYKKWFWYILEVSLNHYLKVTNQIILFIDILELT